MSVIDPTAGVDWESRVFGDDGLDAYSRIVTGVADRLAPSVAGLKVRAAGGRRAAGSGSGLTIANKAAINAG